MTSRKDCNIVPCLFLHCSYWLKLVTMEVNDEKFVLLLRESEREREGRGKGTESLSHLTAD